MPATEEFMRQITVSLPKGIVRKLRQLRLESNLDRSMSGVVREAIDQYIEYLKRGEGSLPRLEEVKLRKSIDNMVPRTLYIGDRQLTELGELAARERVTRALLIRLALEKYLGGGNEENDKPSESS